MRTTAVLLVGFGIGQALASAAVNGGVQAWLAAILVPVGFGLYMHERHISERKQLDNIRQALTGRQP